MNTLLDTWKNRLIDVSGRNPLMSFRFTTTQGSPKTSFIAFPELTEAQLTQLLKGKELKLNEHLRTHLDLPKRDDEDKEAENFETTSPEETVLPEEDRDPQDAWMRHLETLKAHTGEWNLKQRHRVLYNLRSRDRSAEQEMGLNVLFLSYAFLKWRQKPTDDFTYSPLFLLPMDLEKQGAANPQYSLILDEDETVVFNPTLRLFLEQSFGLNLSHIPEKYEEETPTLEELNQQIEQFKSLLGDYPDWEVVQPRAVLAVFHFANLILYNEMERWGEQMAKHPLIARFCDHEPFQQPDFTSARDLDRRPHGAKHDYQVIDADGSQREAIQAAKDGISFVLDGPPGTGKSQTIVNILAELVAQGKKVLFVSQKKAALDVVYYRMAQAGLDNLCLDLHDHRQSNKSFIHHLASTWELLEESRETPLDQNLYTRIQRLKEGLNAYADTMNSRPGALAMSLHTVYARCAELPAKLSFSFPSPLSVDSARLEDIQSMLKRLGRQEKIYTQAQTHPWRALKRSQAFSQTTLETFSETWNQLEDDLQNLQKAAVEWQQLSGLKGWTTRDEWEEVNHWYPLFIAMARPPESWLSEEPGLLRTELQADRRQAEHLQTQWQAQHEFMHSLTPRDIELHLDHVERFEKSGVLKLFSPAWYTFKKQLATQVYQAGKAPTDLGRVRKDLEAYKALQEERQQWLESEHKAAERFKGWETEWEALEQETQTLQTLHNHIYLTPQLKALMGQSTALTQLHANIQKNWESADANLQDVNKVWPLQTNESLTQLLSVVQQQKEALPELPAWIAYAEVRQSCINLGLQDFLDAIIQEKLPADMLEDAFLHRFYHLYLDAAEQQHPALISFEPADHAQQIAEFSTADLQQFALNRQRVWQAHQDNYRHHRQSIPQEQISNLRKLAAQKRPRKRIRWMLKHLRELILQIHPCWMMSPLSVSQFIELEANAPTTIFDTVIFDEASQIYPEDGLCSIFRGKQLIVAGDPLQMPPTSVGRAFLEPDELSDDEDMGADYESVLDLASTILRRRRLMWHYRSRYEELINPSNYHIYAGDLITFPRADRPIEAPVRFHHIAEGRFHKRKNRLEAEAVVERLIQLFRYHQAEEIPLSVGIIAMGLGQQQCIREVIEEKMLEHPELESFFDEDASGEALFIKNLENVQGDERDIILLSVGYGKSPEGKFFQRFGPINQQVGHRRLNVAFTRARQQVEVFCSFHYHEMKIRTNSSAGVRFLRDYLRFAETGHLETSQSENSENNLISPITEKITQALLDKGYQVQNQLGSSRYRMEIAVVDPREPHRYALGIETDGPMYALADTARDRDRLRQQVLTHGGWNLTRVWSKAWSQNPEGYIQQLVEIIEAASLDYAEAQERRQAEFEAFKKELEVLLHSRLTLVWEGHQYAVYKGGLQIHPPMMDACDDNLFAEDLFRFRSGRQVGLMNIEGQILLPALYDYISNEPLDNGFFLIEQKGKIGLMDGQGQILIEPRFDSFEADFSAPFALIEQERHYGFVDNATGEVHTSPQYDWVGEWTKEGAELGLGKSRYLLAPGGEIRPLDPQTELQA